MTSGSTQVMHPAELHATLQARVDELAARSAQRRDARARRARSRRGRGFIAVFGAVTLLLTGALYALAVHDANILEVDANLVDNTDTLGPPIVSGTDWAEFQDSSGNLIPANLPAGTIATTDGVIQDFVVDASGPDPSYHEPSNKDDEGIDPTGGSDVWGCGPAANPTDKDDIINAYAIAVQPGGVGTDLYFYFGVERFDNSGTAFIGVWLFQEDVGCDTSIGKFTGEKKTGDILILTDFTNGGAITSLKAYAFTAGPTPADSGTFTLLTPLGADCDTTAAGDFLCGNVNLVDVPTPWPFQDKDKPGQPNPDPDNIMEISEFFEGGINLTDAFAQTPGVTVPECFGSFLAETRSADVLLGATLKDFALHDFDTCGDITAHKYHDLNANGVDDSDPALSGWTIFIDENSNEVLDGGEQSAVTDGSGDVSFAGLPFGDYDICEVLQANWFNSDPAGVTLCETVTVSAATDPYVDFGNFQQGTKSGTKVEDDDADGTIAEDAANGLLGWTINAYADDGDGVLSAGEFAAGAFATDDTNASGDYTITGLDPGAYVVCEVLETTDWFQSYPVAGSGDCSVSATLGAEGYAIVITSGEDEVDNDFGNFQQGTKSGTKFNDQSNHGVWDFGEPGLVGWTIHLFGTDGMGNAVHVTAVTDANGLYTFNNLNPGSYTVCEELQAGWTQSFPTAGADCTGHTHGGTIIPGPLGYAIVITSGEDEVDNDFGNFQPPNEGCTPGFWQGGFGIQLWDQTPPDPEWDFYGGAGDNPFTTTTAFTPFFNPSGNTFVDGADMLAIVGTGGTNNTARKAARDLIAAYLNASWGLDYSATIAEILADWDDARTGGNAYDFMAFHLEYSAYNQLGCPIP